jgi:hypothetical protein
VVRSKGETREALLVPRNGNRRHMAGFLEWAEDRTRNCPYPKDNVKLGRFTQRAKTTVRPAEQFAA